MRRALGMIIAAAALVATAAQAATLTHNFAAPSDKVYEGLVEVLPAQGFKLKSQDAEAGKLVFTPDAGGEVSVAVTAAGEDKSALSYDAPNASQADFNGVVQAVQDWLDAERAAQAIDDYQGG